jgi:riboflavin biosynthesis pyrimidine reductase
LVLEPFDVLFEGDVPDYPLPFVLQRLYGRLGFKTPILYANFVSSLDGVATLGSGFSAGSVISGRQPADRFLMGLLRACADAVLIGAGTLRATPGHLWTPAHVFPDLAPGFTALRASLGRSPEPRTVILTTSGKMDVKHPALVKGATILTTAAGARKIGGRLPPACDLAVMGRGARLDLARVIAKLRGRGLDVVCSEAGPHLTGELIKSRLLDEIFLTVSPVLAGRDNERRFGMVEGVELLPKAGVWSRLISARRHGDYLFVRYGLRK